MRCVYCLKKKQQKISWRNLWTAEPLVGLCDECDDSLQYLAGNRCKYCSRETEAITCLDCIRWQETGDYLDGNTSVFAYNEQIREMIYQWKYRGDYELGFAFKRAFRKHFALQRNQANEDAIIVPIPLSHKRLAERGFNQATMLATFLPGKVQVPLIRAHTEKQSKKTKQERLFAKNPFCLKEKIKKPVILVDDIYTTGSTMQQAAAILKNGGAPSVKGYTLIRSGPVND